MSPTAVPGMGVVHRARGTVCFIETHPTLHEALLCHLGTADHMTPALVWLRKNARQAHQCTRLEASS